MNKLILSFGMIICSVLSGCGPDPITRCDYCRTLRENAFRYVCDKCKNSHVACDRERAILQWHSEGSGRFQSWSATSIQTCPNPADPSVREEPEAAPPKEQDQPIFRRPRELAVVIVLLFFVLFAGYSKGRNDMKEKLTGGKKQ